MLNSKDNRMEVRTDAFAVGLGNEAFTPTVLHDLRAPLRAMTGFSGALTEEYFDKIDQQGQDYIRRIGQAAWRMDTLIRDLFIYGQLGDYGAVAEIVSLDDLVKEVCFLLSGKIQKTRTQIEVQKPLPQVYAAPMILDQVVTHLIGNAIQFANPVEQPLVQIRATELDGKVRLEIKDNGIGIDSKYYARIFDVFERLHVDGFSSGTGIGLAIVKKGMQIMSGKVGVESELGKGSCFWIELPKA